MRVYDDDPGGEFDEDSEEWSEGECDHCFGETVQTPFGLVYCACAIGQGAPPESCVCGPAD